MVQISTSSLSITSLLVVLCCWCAISHSMVIKENTVQDVLDMLDDENTKSKTISNNKYMDSVTEERTRSLMDQSNDELKKRTYELSILQQYQRPDGKHSSAFDYPPMHFIPGLWERREMKDKALNEAPSSHFESPIPGMWGRELLTQNTFNDKE